ncbi:hypothetical protein [Pedobacter sp. R20-19]|uniref:hypothetical protein n=1 Tax=Pedobacter sp. R20-19 TaxID=1270196 RepID=UPI0004937C5A|nr:hypothetical protein [Pedobacter sp. R20-19]
MKKALIGMCLLLGVSFASTAATNNSKKSVKAVQKKAVEVTTSCGTVYDVTCPSCSTMDLINIALYLDAADCG